MNKILKASIIILFIIMFAGLGMAVNVTQRMNPWTKYPDWILNVADLGDNLTLVDVNVTGTAYVNTFTDNTLTITGGDLTGADDINATEFYGTNIYLTGIGDFSTVTAVNITASSYLNGNGTYITSLNHANIDPSTMPTNCTTGTYMLGIAPGVSYCVAATKTNGDTRWSGDYIPATNSSIDLGNTTHQFAEIYTDNITVSGTFTDSIMSIISGVVTGVTSLTMAGMIDMATNTLDNVGTANIDNIGLSYNMTMQDDQSIGLGAGKGRIEFDDAGTDEINFINANVGIGTTTPTQKLDVNGNINVSSASGVVYFANGASVTTNSTCLILTSPDGTGILNVCDT